MKILFVIPFIMTMSASSFALASEFKNYAPQAKYRTLSVPPQNLLKAAQEIIPQNEPSYFVEGRLSCHQDPTDMPPYKDHEPSCSLFIGDQAALVENSATLIALFKKKVKTMRDKPEFQVYFSAKSLTRNFPLHYTKQTAELRLGILVPSENILHAAQKIEPQTRENYIAHGILTCKSTVVSQTPREDNTLESKCSVTLHDQTEDVENPSEIITVLQGIELQRLEAWTFTGPFTASSLSKYYLPYPYRGNFQHAEIKLYR